MIKRYIYIYSCMHVPPWLGWLFNQFDSNLFGDDKRTEWTHKPGRCIRKVGDNCKHQHPSVITRYHWFLILVILHYTMAIHRLCHWFISGCVMPGTRARLTLPCAGLAVSCPAAAERSLRAAKIHRKKDDLWHGKLSKFHRTRQFGCQKYDVLRDIPPLACRHRTKFTNQPAPHNVS